MLDEKEWLAILEEDIAGHRHWFAAHIRQAICGANGELFRSGYGTRSRLRLITLAIRCARVIQPGADGS